MVNEPTKQWDLSYPDVTLRDTRNALIAEHLFDEQKIWTFHDHTEKKDRTYKTLEACRDAWEDVPSFARSDMTVVPQCDYLKASKLHEAMENAVNVPWVTQVSVYSCPKDDSVRVSVWYQSCEGSLATGGQEWCSGNHVSRVSNISLKQTAFATVSALYHALLASKELVDSKRASCEVTDFNL